MNEEKSLRNRNFRMHLALFAWSLSQNNDKAIIIRA
jgi:hypothetical protein